MHRHHFSIANSCDSYAANTCMAAQPRREVRSGHRMCVQIENPNQAEAGRMRMPPRPAPPRPARYDNDNDNDTHTRSRMGHSCDTVW
jgi:hypothetical protein